MTLLIHVVGCLLALLAMGHTQHSIPLQPIILPVPEISSTYSVVHTSIYPSQQFASSLPKDFYVSKALKNKPRLSSQPLPQSQKPAQFDPNVPNLNPTPQSLLAQDLNNNRVEPQRMEKKEKRTVEKGALSVNNKQSVQWKIKAQAPFPPFVIEKGEKKMLSKGSHKTKTQIIFGQLEGVAPEDNPAPPPRPTPKITIPPATPTPNPSFTPTPQQQTPKKQEKKESGENNNQPKQNLKKEEQEHFEWHESQLLMLGGAFVAIILVFLMVRAQKISKQTKVEQVHSKLQNYREEDETSLFKEEEAGRIVGRQTKLVDDDDSSDEEPMQGNQLMK